MTRRAVLIAALSLLALTSCNSNGDEPRRATVTTRSTTGGGPAIEVTEVARDLDTVWALAWDPQGHLHWTERGGRLTRQGTPPVTVDGVHENGEGGLMGLAIDGRGRQFVMYTGADDNRIVRLEADGSQKVLVDGIARAGIHDGGRLVFGPDGKLYASTGDAGDQSSVRKNGSLNGKVLRIDPESGASEVWSTGHRNIQGLCFGPGGGSGVVLYATEHGPDRGDEINVIAKGSDGGWPETVGNGIKNWTPTIAPAGCTIPTADLIPQWKGHLLFGTLKESDLRVLTLSADGRHVTLEQVLYDERFGRIRDVKVGPDGAVYLATSNNDGRGSPRSGDDRILRLAPRA